MKGYSYLQGWQRLLGLVAVFLLLGAFSAFGAISNPGVDIDGVVYTTSFPVTLTPDNDGVADNLNFVFTGSGDHEYMLVVDTDGDTSCEPVVWDPDANGGQGAQDGDDWTWMGYANDGETPYIWWEGKDKDWRTVPNGTYQVWIVEDTGDDGFGTGTDTTDNTISVTITTKYISGTVTDGKGTETLDDDTLIEGVRVNAGGPDGWGEATTAADGTYTVYGLKEGSYHMNAEKVGYVYNPEAEGDVTLSGDSATLDITMQEAETVTLNVSMTSAFDPRPGFEDGSLWINADAQRTDGEGWAHGNDEIADGQSSGEVTLNFESLPAEAKWNIRVTAEYCYWDNGQEYRYSYTGSRSDLEVSADDVIAVDLVKAVSITGTVNLPDGVTASQNMNINVRAQAIDDPSNEAWGWGNIQIDANFGTFNIPAVRKNTTYTCYIQVDGYKTATIGDVVVVEDDKAAGDVTLDAGFSITGTLHVGGAIDEQTSVWIDAWSPSDFNWHGQQITIPVNVDAQDIDFTITGLEEDLSYELNCWKQGYEFTVNGEMPWGSKIAAGSTGVALALTAFSGKISGTITADGVDMSHVVVAVNSLWGGPGGGIIQPVTADGGTYEITGLSSGEYLVVVDEMVDPQANPPIPTGTVAMSSDVVFVANGETTTLNITLSEPYTVTGTVTDTEHILLGDDETLGGGDDPTVMAVAMPIQFSMMGDMQGGTIMAPVTNADGTFTLKVGSGTYIIALASDDVDFASEQAIKVVSGTTAVELAMADGYTANVTINFPAPVSLDGGNPRWLGCLELFKDGQPLGEAYRKELIVRPNPGWTCDWNPDAILLDVNDTYKAVSVEHLLPGEYMARFFSPEYIMGKTSFTISEKDVSSAITLETGATISGKLVDADTGSNLLKGNNASSFVITCEAIPHIEGSFKSTEWAGPDDEVFDANGVFYLRNLPEGTYLLNVSFESSSSSNLNYAATSVYGTTITGTSTFDIGTIKIKQGTTITGQVTDTIGNPLPNIPVEAELMDSKYGEVLIETKTGPDGFYTLTGIDPEIPYYEVAAAIRPDPWEMMMQPCGYGEVFKLNVAPGSTGVNFELSETTASLSGDITIPADKTLAPPFADDEMANLPIAIIILQRKGVAYPNPMEGGIEEMSLPQDGASDGTNPVATYTIDNLVPGTYRIMLLSAGLATYVNSEVVVSEGSNELDITLAEGATVSGTVTKPDGTHPTTTDIEEVVAINTSQEMVFGTFTKDPATGEILSYEIKGLKAGAEYRVALCSPGEDGPGDIYVQNDAVTPTSASDSLTLNAVMVEGAPTFMIMASKDGDDVNIGVFSTTHLRDENVSDMIDITTDDVANMSNALLSMDKTNLSFTYTPGVDETSLAFTITAHYGADYTRVQTNYTIDLTVDGANQGMVNNFMGGKVGMGGGDASGIYFEPGDIEDDGDGKTVVDVTNSEVGAGGESVAGSIFAAGVVVVPEDTDALPSWATAASQQYDFSIGVDAIADSQSVTVTLQYTDGTDTDNLHVLHYTSGAWQVEATNPSIDTINKTVSVDVTSLSPFVAVTGTVPDDSTPLYSGGSSGGTCFVETACSTGGIAGMLLPLLFMIPLVKTRMRK